LAFSVNLFLECGFGLCMVSSMSFSGSFTLRSASVMGVASIEMRCAMVAKIFLKWFSEI